MRPTPCACVLLELFLTPAGRASGSTIESIDSPKTYHVRDDLVGSVVEFDGDRVVIDFYRVET
jgi:hypothetical protein